MIYVTGDTHRDFDRIADFCAREETTKEDLMIVLGDAGVNFYEHNPWRDHHVKQWLESLPISFLFIHGNHEMRPNKIPTYAIKQWNLGQGFVYVEDDYPSLAFAVDGCVYEKDDLRMLVCGGAYSVDKFYRQERGLSWWDDEQPNQATKLLVEKQATENQNIDYVLTHTCPFRYRPVEVFLPMIDQSTVDASTELWLDTIYDIVPNAKWQCGHYHIDKIADNNIRFLYNDIISISSDQS